MPKEITPTSSLLKASKESKFTLLEKTTLKSSPLKVPEKSKSSMLKDITPKSSLLKVSLLLLPSPPILRRGLPVSPNFN